MSFYTVYHPDAAQRVLASESGRYRKDNQFYAEVRWAVGDGLLTSQDERWRRQRRLTQPLFAKARVAAAAPSIVIETDRLTRRWHSAAASGAPIDLHAEMTCSIWYSAAVVASVPSPEIVELETGG